MTRIGLAAAAVVLAGACGGGGATAGERETVVMAASSLTESFTALGEVFEAEHDGTSVTFNFASSSDLAVQINEGAPADVFASADAVAMDIVEDARRASRPAAFATNRLVLAVPADNPAEIADIEDLTRPGVKVVLAGPEVPAGNYARKAFAKLGIESAVEVNVVSNEDDVKQVVTKVRLGEADAGVVYATDIASEVAQDVDVIELPDAAEVEAVYSVAVLRDAPNAAGARAFVELLLCKEGRDVLRRHGFRSP